MYDVTFERHQIAVDERLQIASGSAEKETAISSDHHDIIGDDASELIAESMFYAMIVYIRKCL